MDPAPLCLHCALPVPSGRRSRSNDEASFCCFGCRIASRLARPALDGESRTLGGTLLLRLGLGIFLALNIMAFSWLSYAGEIFGAGGEPHGSLAGLFAYLMLFLCTLVVVLLGLPLVSDSIDGRGGSPVNLLIFIGVASAYLLSAIHTLRGQGGLYYDTAAMVLVLVTLGNYLEAEARRRASRSGDALLTQVAQRAWVERDDAIVELDAEAVRPGDRVRARPGESVPVDGVVLEGASLVDESTLTGESSPRAVRAGDMLLAGVSVLDGQLWIRADRVGAGRVAARIRELLHQARQQQPPIQRMADRVAAAFVPAVVLVAAGTFAWSLAQGTATAGLFSAMSVLLISCPCALGLAAPLAIWNALRRAAAKGILVDSAVTLERAAEIDRLFFDKTGTLTRPDPRLDRIEPVRGRTEDEVLALAATLESASLHPIARAMVRAAVERGLPVGRATHARVLPGLGIEATVDSRRFRLGNERLLGEGHAGRRDGRSIYLCEGDALLARFDLVESLRDDAADALEALRGLGVQLSILTGDGSDPAARLASELGIPFEAGLLPQDKMERVEAARERGRGRIGMVGDGINDAPVLASADVGVAMGSAADLARRAGNVALIADRIDRVPLLLRMARHTHRRIRVSLLWAFAYNALGIPLAAVGLLSPVFAALAMIASSLTVVGLARGAGRVAPSRPESGSARPGVEGRPSIAVEGG